MKIRILFRSLIFVLIVLVSDWLVGKAMAYMYGRTHDITISKIRYTFFDSDEDILILGSSRAQHHYIPEVLVKGTGLTAFNGGLGGQPLAFSLVQLSETFKRYKPKAVILDVTPDFRFDHDSDPRLKILGPYYKTNSLARSILLDNGTKFERVKYMSSVYPYNGVLADLVLACFYVPDVSIKGYIASPGGSIDPDWQMNESEQDYNGIPAKQKRYLKAIADLCNEEGVKLWIIISPLYNTTEGEKIISAEVSGFASESGIGFLNFSQALTDYRLFKDHLHLSTAGAEAFTVMVRDSLFFHDSNLTSCMSVAPQNGI